ncbi:ROK family transcriptional regulator [Frankia sp. Cpl3]|nr:ROK family transcriptional regulator [Frankia sp. Cpl3]
MAPTSNVVRSAQRSGGAGELFQMLRDGRPRTRADLATRTGQARSTIAARVDQLLASGLVTPTGESASTGGRPPTTFVFNPGARLVVAVDLGALHGHVAITDLAANVLAERSEPLPIQQGPDDVLDWVARTGLDLLAQSGRSLDEVVGVGVGLPGPVNHETGRLTHPPIMPGWDDYDVPARLSSVFRTSVLVDNDVNIMALGEYHTAWRNVDHLLFIKIATGIGAGIINDGRLSRGAQGAAGDLGHVAVAGREDVPCRCGNAGCLEAVASGQAIARTLRRHGLDVPGSDEVVTAVRAGSLLAGQTVRQAGRDIGGVLATCVSLLNPAVIVLGGIVAEAGEYLLAGIREVVYRRSLPLATQHLRIVSSQAKGRAGILGASIMVTDHVLSPTAVDALLT